VTRMSVDQKQELAQRYADDERQRVQSVLSCEADTTSSHNDVNSDDDDDARPPSDKKDLTDVQPVSSQDDEHAATTDSGSGLIHWPLGTHQAPDDYSCTE